MVTPLLGPVSALPDLPAGRRLNLLPPLLVSAAIAMLGASLVAILPGRFLDPLQRLLFGLDGLDSTSVGVPLRSILMNTAWVGWVCSALALLPFVSAVHEPSSAGVRYLASLGLRVLFNFGAALVIGLSFGWPLKSVVLCLAFWYIVFLFAGELMFITRFVAGFDRPRYKVG